MLKFKNPYFQPADELAAQKHAGAVDEYLKANPDNKLVTMAEIKTALPAIAGELNRAVVNIIMQKLNIEVVNPQDNAA